MTVRDIVMSSAGASGAPANYIEDVFSTFLYTGNGSTQTINNGIDLAGKGGLVWFKSRSTTNSHRIFDTARGIHKFLNSSDTGAQTTNTSTLTAFNSTGFDIGSSSVINTSGELMASWTFRKQPKFFDVVTYTGNGVAGRNISHALTSVPGFVVVKRTDTTGDWRVLHRNDGTNWLTGRLISSALDTSPSPVTFGDGVVFIAPTSTQFTVGSFADVNASGGTYVAYLFAHNAGGFGLTGTDNVISCGSFTTDGSGNATVNLGYEPQWVLIKASSTSGSWRLMDNMRGMPVTANSSTATGGRLYPNFSNADDGFPSVIANATGFVTVPGTVGNSETNIYIAIRRGPMKTPTTGTSVFAPSTQNDSTFIPAGFPVDAVISLNRAGGNSFSPFMASRLTGDEGLVTSSNAAAVSGLVPADCFQSNTSVFPGSWGASAATEMFRRAPGFFDVVCYTGDGESLSHNLGVVPELIIAKARGTSGSWRVTSSATTGVLYLDATDAKNGTDSFQTLTPCTATTMNLSGISQNTTNVAYLFASCPGVSKVGSYTGNGSSQTIDCGFAAGARFVLVKRTNAAGDWYIWDTARGIVASNDPHLSLNSTAAEVTTNDSVDPVASGFAVNQVAATNINVSGASYIYLAIA